jgi:hypothetical protein
LIIESVGTSLVVGKLRKGKFSNMVDAEIHKWYLIVSAFILEFAAVALSAKGNDFVTQNIFLIHFISYGLLFLGICFNTSRLSFKLILLGTFLNFIVIMLNGGQMPVSQEAMVKAGLAEDLNALVNGEIITHIIMGKNTALKFLGDIFILPEPYPRPKVFSLGDIFLGIGIFVYIQEIMVRKSLKREQ